jgi:Ca-activated chloride channel homolog
MNNPTLLLTPRRTALLAGHDNTVDVLVRVQAPELPAAPMPARQPLHLALVIDRSGSMSGQPLHEARRCAEFVIDGLIAGDSASLVVYDDHVHTLAALTQASDREALRRAVRGIASGGSTDLHAGWLQGAETLAQHTSARIVSRVILLSDGCANHGLTDTAAIAAQCTALAEAGVTTSTYGLGRNFNEELMIAMARAGGGNGYFGQTADDLMDPFREELALLNTLCARRLELGLKARDGVRLEMLNEYADAGESTWRLPDLAYEGEAWALVRLHVARDKVAELQQHGAAALLTANVRYVDLAGQPCTSETQTLSLPALEAAAFNAIAEDVLVKRRVDELEAAGIQRQARTAAQQGDWPTVERLLRKVDVLGDKNEWVRGILAELRNLARQRDHETFSKESLYGAHRMSTRLTALHEPDAPQAEVAAFLRRKTAQGKGEPPPAAK